MEKYMRTFLILLIMLTGCASNRYVEPSDEMLSSNLTFSKSSYSAVSYMAFDNAQCRRTAGMGMIKVFSPTERASSTSKLALGNRIYLFASSYIPRGTSVALCDNLVSFTPQPGENYTAQHVAFEKVCRVEIFANSTKMEPSDLTYHETPKGCGGL
jgi:hypothetical protein